MPIYKYKFVKDEVEQEETKEFSDKASLYAAIRANNGTVLSVKEMKSKKLPFNFFSFKKKIKSQEIITFAKNLSVMVDAGLSVSRALSVLGKQSRNKNLYKYRIWIGIYIF